MEHEIIAAVVKYVLIVTVAACDRSRLCKQEFSELVAVAFTGEVQSRAWMISSCKFVYFASMLDQKLGA